jgi:hypothetical protein
MAASGLSRRKCRVPKELLVIIASGASNVAERLRADYEVQRGGLSILMSKLEFIANSGTD